MTSRATRNLAAGAALLVAVAVAVLGGGHAGARSPGAPGARADAAQAVETPGQKVLYRDGHGDRYLLDGSWYFRADPANQGLAEAFQRQPSLVGWSAVTVPNAWNATDLSDASQRGSIGWYRKDFRLPPAARTASWVLRFESVNYRATVFLNGRAIGRHEGAYVPFELDLARAAKRGTNTLVVRVDSRHGPTDLPPGRDQANGRPGGGWWNYGGLLREVYLRKVDRIDIVELLARPVLPCARCDAAVLVRATLRNPGSGRRRVRLRASVGGVAARFPRVKIGSHGSREVSAWVKIANPRLWEPASPELYRVSARATVGRGGGSSYSTHIGIRSLKVRRDGRMLLNGRPVQLRGASLHEDDPTVGAALSPERRKQDFELLRQLGATLTRAHYPLHPGFLELADRGGVLVWDQIPFYQVRNAELRAKAVRAKGLAALAATIRRDQNHPSVMVWSIGNELSSRPTRGQEHYIRDSVKLIRRLDPTRLSAIDVAGYPSVEPATPYRRLDAIGINSYFGWYPGPGGQIIDRELLGPYLDQLHRSYPTEALFVTEFGAEANRSGPIDEKGTDEYQRDLVQFHLETYDRKRFVNGALVWLLRDFRVRPGWDGGNPKPNPPVNAKGLVDQLGRKKPAFDEAARLFRNVEPLR